MVVAADAGAGKSTRVPPALARALAPAGEQILVLQPRRVAARTLAARMADEWPCEVGDDIGYQVRFDRRASARSRVVVMTEGILIRRMQRDPFLEGVRAVVLDEFHERSVYSDLAISLLRELRAEVRPDLAVVVMSASLDVAPVADFLPAQVVRVPGRTFPVAIERQGTFGDPRDLAPRLAATIREAIAGLERDGDAGHVLAFLPGAREIDDTVALLGRARLEGAPALLPLHGGLSPTEQARALAPSGRRKVVLATNIAETSLTVEDLAVVIDSGWERRAGFDSVRGMARLQLCRISVASATQRAGRVGRTRPGRALRLWSDAEERALEPFTPPEIRRTDLAGACLEIRAWSGRPAASFAFFEAPEPAALERAERELRDLEAVDVRDQLTPLGRALLSLPVDPRLGRLLHLARETPFEWAACALAAWLSEAPAALTRHAAQRAGSTTLDAETIVRWVQAEELGASEAGSAHARSLDRVRRVAAALHRAASDSPEDRRSGGATARRPRHRRADSAAPAGPRPRHAPSDGLTSLLVEAMPGRVAEVRASMSEDVLLASGTAARLVAPLPPHVRYLVVLDVGGGHWTRGGFAEVPRVIAAEPLSDDWIDRTRSSWLTEARSLEYDETRRELVELRTRRFGSLELSQVRLRPAPTEHTTQRLADALCRGALEWVDTRADLGSLVRRWRWLARHAPEEIPSVDTTLEEAVRNACHGHTRASEVANALARGLPYTVLPAAAAQRLAALAPESLTLPSGRTRPLRYESPDEPPELHAPIQELFGCPETPRVAGGRVAVRVVLLAPSGRAAQVTTDLGGFWRGSYREVRKELRGRYPKHYWPEDPSTASFRRPGRGRSSTAAD